MQYIEEFGGRGKLFVISGPSGVGKGTICKRLLEDMDIEISISATTRKPRVGEIDKLSYFFVEHDAFRQMVRDDEFLEYAEVFGNFYGTPRKAVEEKLCEGKDVILEIDVQGAMAVKSNYPQCVTIFICPPSISTLKRRLAGRGSETEESINLRVTKAIEEIKILSEYDYYVINDELDDAVKQIKSIIYAERHKIDGIADSILAKYMEEE